MKSIFPATVLSSLVLAGQACAAGGAAEDNSDFVVWAFLAFCALIVIGQLAPMIKHIRAQKPQPERNALKEKA